MSPSGIQDPHEQYAELAAGYALSALEPAEEQLFLAHLAGCARCEQELREHIETGAHLAYAADAPEPPQELLESIRAAVLASGRGAVFADGQALPAVADGRPDDQDEMTELDRARHRRAGRVRRAARVTSVAAAASLVLGLGFWNSELRQQSEQQRSRSDALAAQMVSELGIEGARSVPLRNRDGQTVAVALMHGSDVSLLHRDLPVNARDTTYVLWGRDGVEVRAVGTFDVTGTEAALVRGLHAEAGLEGMTELMVTHESGRAAPRAPKAAVLASGAV